LDSDINASTMTSGKVQLNPGDDNRTVDAGLYLPASLGNQVWIDVPGGLDNLYDAGDLGVEDVVVNLFDAVTGDLIDTQLTDNLGNYLFTGLAPGDYYVEFVLPAGYEFVEANVGGDDEVDSDADVTTGITGTYILSSGESNLTVDAGLTQPVDLELVKSVNDETPNVGDVVTFTIEVSNVGVFAGTNVQVTDYLPNGYSNPASISNGGSASGNTIIWNGLDIPAGGSISLTFDATVNATGDYLNIAEITQADQGDVDSTPGNDDGDQSEDDEDNAIVVPCDTDITAITVDVSCFGEATGSIDATVIGTVGTVTYNWSNGATTEDLADLAAGDYAVTATDANGCIATGIFTIAQPATAIAASADGVETTCGEDNGSAIASANGGTALRLVFIQ